MLRPTACTRGAPGFGWLGGRGATISTEESGSKVLSVASDGIDRDDRGQFNPYRYNHSGKSNASLPESLISFQLSFPFHLTFQVGIGDVVALSRPTSRLMGIVIMMTIESL